MRIAGIREFRDRAPALIKGDEIVLVTRHGKLTGFLVPLSRPEELPLELRREMLAHVGSAIAAHLKRHGVSEDQVQRDFKGWKSKRRARRGRR